MAIEKQSRLGRRRLGKTDVTVALVPNVRGRFDLYRSTTTDSSGHFHFDRVPPGSYKVFPWTDVEADSWFDPDFMRDVEARGGPQFK